MSNDYGKWLGGIDQEIRDREQAAARQERLDRLEVVTGRSRHQLDEYLDMTFHAFWAGNVTQTQAKVDKFVEAFTQHLAERSRMDG